jgi:hypothetical protein
MSSWRTETRVRIEDADADIPILKRLKRITRRGNERI